MSLKSENRKLIEKRQGLPLIDMNKTYVTFKDNLPVKLLYQIQNEEETYPIIGLINEDFIARYTRYGKIHIGGWSGDLDLKLK